MGSLSPVPICCGTAVYRQTGPSREPPYLFETNVPGVFVAGDARHGSIKRVASGVGEGTIAEKMIERYLDEV